MDDKLSGNKDFSAFRLKTERQETKKQIFHSDRFLAFIFDFSSRQLEKKQTNFRLEEFYKLDNENLRKTINFTTVLSTEKKETETTADITKTRLLA